MMHETRAGSAAKGRGAVVLLTGVSLSEGGWREPSNMLEPTLGGGLGERCVKPLARRLRSSLLA